MWGVRASQSWPASIQTRSPPPQVRPDHPRRRPRSGRGRPGPDDARAGRPGFDAGGFLHAIAATKAQFLVRLTSTRRPPVAAQLPDGSVLLLIGEVKVRIITATVTVTCHDGSVYGDSYRWATT